MKRFATGILIVAASIYVPARLYEAVYPSLGYLRAFCEAAMIGGLADWFAVTALFRYPLGVPLPHTAIIPNNKERIADALARFVEFNFLSSEVVTERLSKIDFALLAANWMADPQRSGSAVARIVEFLPRVFGLSCTEPLRRFVREHCSASLADADFAPVATALLKDLIAEHRRSGLVDALITLMESHLGNSEAEILASLEQKTAGIRLSLGLDVDASQRMNAALARMLVALRGDAGRVARAHLTQLLFDMLEELCVSPTFTAEVNSFKRSLWESPVCIDWGRTIVDRIGSYLQDDLRRSDSGFRIAAQSAVCGLGENLVSNTLVRLVLNTQIRQFFVTFVEKRRHHAAELIAETMRNWDAVTMSGRIEEAIGRDLQYIRINGTLIGGLIGVVIHTVSTLALR